MQNQEHGFKHNKEAPPAPLCWWRVDGKFNLRVTVGEKEFVSFITLSDAGYKKNEVH